MREVVIEVDSRGGGASIRALQGVATRKIKRLYPRAKEIASYGLQSLDGYDGSKVYKYKFEVKE